MPSRLEEQFSAEWGRLFPDLPFSRNKVIPPWEDWAVERKAIGWAKVRRAYDGDFIFWDARVAVEIQGATFVTGGHSTGTGIERDAIKALTAAFGGWLVVPLTGGMLRKKQAGIWLPKLAEVIRARACESAKSEPLALAHLS